MVFHIGKFTYELRRIWLKPRRYYGYLPYLADACVISLYYFVSMLQGERPTLPWKSWTLIIAAWSLTQAFFLFKFGINDQNEAIKYIDAAGKILGGTYNPGIQDIWYAGYISLHVLIKAAGLHVKTMYFVQLLFSFFSLIYFVRIISLWTASRITVILSAILYGTCFFIQEWVSQLFTDSIFSSLLIISLYFLLCSHKSWKNQIVLWILIVILPFFRPVGFLFMILACFYWIICYQKTNLRKLFICTVYLILIIVLAGISFSRSDYFYPFHNLDANVICGLSSDLLKYQVVPYNQDTKIAEYFWQNPEMSVRLFALRFYKVFSLTRPFYSSVHNLTIIIISGVLYLLAIAGMISVVMRKNRQQLILIAGCFLFSLPSVALCVEWHGRMSVPSLCFIVILAGLGLQRLLVRRPEIIV